MPIRLTQLYQTPAAPTRQTPPQTEPASTPPNSPSKPKKKGAPGK
jgi:hypothetical protein